MAVKTSPVIINVINNSYQKIVLNRPTQKNAITIKMYEELSKILDDSAGNENVNMLVMTGTGDYYSSGNDLKTTIENVSTSNATAAIETFNGAYKGFVDSLINYPKLLVGVVNGPAIGIMATTLALFDVVYASDKAFFQTPFSNYAFTAEGCSTYTFPRIMGNSKAGDMLYFGYKMSADEARECGFVSRVYPHEELDKVWLHLDQVVTLSLRSMLATKRLVKKWDRKKLLDVNAAEAETLKGQWQEPELIERIIKFISRKSKY